MHSKISGFVRFALAQLLNAAAALLILGGDSATAGSPGLMDPSFQVPYLADRGILRPDGSCVVAGNGVVTVLNRDGSVRHGPWVVAQAQQLVTSEMALLQDGSVVGGFTDGFVFANQRHTFLFRISPAGALENLPVENNANDIALDFVADLGDGRLAVAGVFPAWAKRPNSGSALGILSSQRSFEPKTTHEVWGGGWARAGAVKGMAPAGEGRYLAFGYFTHVDLVSINGIARFLSDGRLDPSFRPEFGINSVVWNAVVLPDGKILVGGWLALPHLGNVAVARLMPDGSLDRTFNPPLGTPYDASTVLVRSLSVDFNQRIVIYGVFESMNGVNFPGLARLNSDGSVDATFQPQQPLPDRDFFVDYPEYAVDLYGDVYVFGGNLNDGPLAGNRALRFFGGLDQPAAPSIPLDTSRLLLKSGSSITLSAPAVGLPLPGFRWERNGEPLLNETNSTLRINAVRLQDAGSYHVVARNALGSTRRQIAVLSLNGPSVPVAGGIDTGFNGPTNGATVVGMALLPGGGSLLAFSDKIGISQSDTVGEIAHGIKKLKPDGTVDPNFWTHLTVKDASTPLVCSLSVTSDGRILIGGNFETVNGVSRRSVARLLSDGSLDSSFDALDGAVGVVNSITLVPGLGVVVGGQFLSFQGQTNGPLALLGQDGRVVPGWPSVSFSPKEAVVRLWTLPEGDLGIWSSGPQDGSGDGARWSRLNQAGDQLQVVLSLPQDASLQGVELTQDKRLLFATSGRTNQPHTVVRSMPWDQGAHPPEGPSAILQGRVYALALDPSGGAILAGVGQLNWPGAVARTVLRLKPNGEPDLDFTLSSGIGALGSTRSPMLVLPTGRVILPTTQGIRAFYSRSEQHSAPKLVGPLGDQDYESPSLDAPAGDAVTFTAPIGGAVTSYQWWFNGSPLSGEERITLVLTNPLPNDIGSYWVVGSNGSGSVTSRVAQLRLVPRAIDIGPILPPNPQNLWSTLTVSADLSGSWPIRAHWYRDGRLLEEQTSPTLTIPTLSQTDVGIYQIAVSNPTGTRWGSPFRVSLTQVPLGISDAVDTPGAFWTGSPVWKAETTDTSDNVDAVYALATDSATNAICKLQLIGPGTLSFFWRLDRKTTGLLYELQVDGKKAVPVTGVDSLVPPGPTWAPQHYRLRSGTHTVGWKFSWPSRSSGNVAYLDQVQFVADTPQLPSIDLQPSAVTVREGEVIQFGVGVSGFLPVSYQWRKDGKEIPGATGQAFRLTGASLADEGNYDVVVSNASGSVTSVVVRATVLPSIANTRLPLPSLDADGIPSFVVPLDAAFVLELQGSENLVDWFNVTTWVLSGTDGNARMVDPEVQRSPQRFYRLVPTK